MDPHLIDRLYECAFVPEAWPIALRGLAEIATARTGFLYVSKGDVHRWASSNSIGVEAVKPLIESGWVARSERFRRLLAARDSGFLTEADIYPRGDPSGDPAYRDVIYPRGLGHCAATVVSLPTGEDFSVALSVSSFGAPSRCKLSTCSTPFVCTSSGRKRPRRFWRRSASPRSSSTRRAKSSRPIP